MSKTEDELNVLVERLSKANTEEEIIEHLRTMVKGFSPSMYIEFVRSNPYFKSLFEDVRQIVFDDIEKMKAAIKDEIFAIDKEKSHDNEAMQKLSNLKIECKMLLVDLIEKEKEIMAIKI